MNRTQALKQSTFDTEQWQKLYYRHPQQYIRKRLDAIKLLMDGQSRTQVCQQLNCSYDTLTSWIDGYLTGGLAQLVVAITHNKPSRLTVEQQQQLKAMLLQQRPSDYGIDRQIWTGAIIAQVIEQRWGVQLKDSRIYEILDELGLSHQRGHRDYANADRQQQQQWVEAVKKNSDLSRPMRRSSSSMSLPSMTVRACSMAGQNATLALKCPVMKVLGINSMDCCVSMPSPGKSFYV